MGMRFLIAFRGFHNHFRVAEVRSVLCIIRGCADAELGDLGLISAYDVLTKSPSPPGDPLHVKGLTRGAAGVVLHGEVYAYINLASEDEAKALGSRCLLIRAILLPLGHGACREECAASVTKDNVETVCAPLFSPSKPSYRVIVEVFGRSLSMEEQVERVHAFSFVHVKFPGPVRLRNPDHELWVMEDAFPPSGHGYKTTRSAPRQVLFGRLVVKGAASLGSSFTLKKRAYIGPTSMDAELAFVMANFGGVRPGSFVMDPFAGTGGVLVPCAKFQAHTVAADISITALKGKQDKGIESNFSQYALHAPVGILRCDAFHNAFRAREGGWFDAVITDPPYGVKEGAKAFREESVDSRIMDMHFQGTERVRVHDLLDVLLDFAATMLIPGGRLVYWLATTPDSCESDVPTHPMLEIVYNCEQPLTTRMSRRLIVMTRRISPAPVDAENETRNRNFDLAAKILHQPERDESRLKSRARR